MDSRLKRKENRMRTGSSPRFSRLFIITLDSGLGIGRHGAEGGRLGLVSFQLGPAACLGLLQFDLDLIEAK